MIRKLSALFAIMAATVLAGWGAGGAVAAPAKAFIGGGSGILVLKGGNSAAACTLTTIGHSKTGKLIGITAGHCGTPGQRVYSETYQNRGQIGTVTYSASDLDMAIIAFDPAKVVPLRTVHGVTIRAIDPRAASFPTIACKEGRTTGNTCGIVWFSEDTAHYSQICVVEGDSGSPVVVGDRLIGMVNAYYFTSCIGPETGTNIEPILARVRSLPAYGGYTPI
ncbi:serine protease [Gordonia sp. TBRC 11910]|uniref:Serine protease n=1 Tax=Gordonia asplenii TaxID=2725283 RepID=A0A848KWW3_9ACTN|nr:serine protease [Gordonia asplenii]NMO01355.1 serine protease [Gordonia asplenii]